MILLMYDPVQAHLQRLQQAAPDQEIAIAHSLAEARALIENAEIVLGNRYFIQSLPFARKLRWMQSNSVGVDIILTEKQLLLERGVTLTCARGVYDAELAEHTLTLLLALFRNIHLLRDEQVAHSWQRHRLRTLHGSRCLILGWGSLAQEIARLITAIGGHVAAVRNQPGNSEEQGISIFGQQNWQMQLAYTDALIVCLPKTPGTHHFVNPAILNQLPERAFVINIGRGGTLDDQALLESVQAGKLAGAALDVFEEEPLPASHPMWTEPRILITPHVGRSLEGPEFKWQPLFEENLARYMRGETLLNVVNYEKGY
ncbi:D-2-hydroxyacid dehydrogenase [Dyadobacter jiangsuensis]|uniref:Phosphoglycerate dehydrogenase-like enzyme n=1 Tax=Dyadobacter jiangsuensis TaxID=1591085 RepID=A0A2P8FIK4_9BACT|nr:D-2-hydroxyacid dehydrogenase [Dyadobacter jiangsuensis]PSL21546.1 phosphoglycerate dehydrogenase-like enzyme [Dyadobacter jiangsuensis]